MIRTATQGDAAGIASIYNHHIELFFLLFDEPVSLSALAELAGVHEVSLVRAFRRVFGAPHRLQNELRVGAAQRLLDRGSSVSEAALRVGFYDQSHLTRHFKRIVGVPPGRYAQGARLR